MSSAVERARDLLANPGSWLEARGGGYVLRQRPDRRARVVLTLGEAEFRELARAPGLAVRPGGGWARARGTTAGASPSPGRPGFIDGQLTVTTAEGATVRRRANLGESPIAWLARRKDHAGRPWLTPAEAAAGERLRIDGEIVCAGSPLTMRWDALPRGGTSAPPDRGPGDRALAASRRVSAALAAVGPDLAPIVSRVCLCGGALQETERALGLRRRQGKTLLKEGLSRLAAHYSRS